MSTLVDDNQMMFDILLSTDSQPTVINITAGTDIQIVIVDKVATITYTGG